MLEDDATRLEQIVGEALFSISWLLNAIAARITEASIEPAADHEVSEHIDLITAEFCLATWLVLGSSGLALIFRA